MQNILIINALRCVCDARRELQKLYFPSSALELDPKSEEYQRVAAGARAPAKLQPLSEAIRAALGHLVNLRIERAGDDLTPEQANAIVEERLRLSFESLARTSLTLAENCCR